MFCSKTEFVVFWSHSKSDTTNEGDPEFSGSPSESKRLLAFIEQM
jgi:hypothetical protein